MLFLIAVLLISCKKETGGSGTVISAVDGKPLDYVRVYWANNPPKSIVTDSLGRFRLSDDCRCFPQCPDLELAFRRRGYETKYEIIRQESSPSAYNLVIKMTPSPRPEARVFKETPMERNLKSLNALLSLINMFTLTMIGLSTIKNKTGWILCITFLSITIKYNYFSTDLQFYPFSFLVQIRANPTGWYLYYVPVTAIAFWIYYFYKKRKGENILRLQKPVVH